MSDTQNLPDPQSVSNTQPNPDTYKPSGTQSKSSAHNFLNLPNLYTQLANKVRETGAESLTLDLFDTVLLRKSWPEELQNLQVAAAWQSSLPEIFASHSPSTILAWRQFAYAELRALHDGDLLTEFQPSLETWFDALINLMSNFYQLHLSDEQRENAVKIMLKDELDILAEALTPNRPLFEAVTSLKTALPELKVYFLEDSPYCTSELKDLLKHFEINVFDGGLSSTDAAVTKHSGRLYQYIKDTDALATGNFDLSKNLHIGDNRRSDYSCALRAGSAASHYRPIRFRGLRTLAGHARALYLSHQNNTFPKKTALSALHLCFYAAHHPETRFLVPAELMPNFDGLTLPANLQVTPQLSHETTCKAMVWFLANRHDQAWNANAIAQVIISYLGNNSRLAIYDFCFENNFPSSDFLLSRRTADEFCAALLNDLITADVIHTASLRQSYIDLAELLPLVQEGIAIVESSSKHPAQTLFNELAKLHGVTVPVGSQLL